MAPSDLPPSAVVPRGFSGDCDSAVHPSSETWALSTSTPLHLACNHTAVSQQMLGSRPRDAGASLTACSGRLRRQEAGDMWECGSQRLVP